MIRFHPDENTLIEYASGAMDTAMAIAIKSHLHMCPKCRNRVSELKQVGAAFFDEVAQERNVPPKPQTEVSSESFAALMTRIRTLQPAECELSEPSDSALTQNHAQNQVQRPDLPPVLNKLINKQGKLKWDFVSPSLKQANLITGQHKYEVCFHKIRRGGKVVEHDHRGLEITVVLEGSFSDENGTYRKGDFLLREPGDTHRPTATQDQDCLCLSVVSAPVKLKGMLGRIVNPFLRISPA